MSKIFVGQSSLRIQVTTSVNIAAATELLIKYIKPDDDATEGSWVATEGTAATGIFYYDLVDEDDLDVAGVWTFWGYVTFSDGRGAPGEIFKVRVYEEGTNT